MSYLSPFNPLDSLDSSISLQKGDKNYPQEYPRHGNFIDIGVYKHNYNDVLPWLLVFQFRPHVPEIREGRDFAL